MIDQVISHYRIVEKLGEGGMGVVYKAQDTKLDRFVALKFLPERVADSEQDRARFMHEAKAASALNHPNICTIHGIEEHEGQMFLIMEYVDGQTLTEKKLTISFKQAIDIGIQLAEGLAAAHEKGIVHRDIKPDNIMIRKDGIAQIMDFGLAKLRGVSRLTKEGSTIGTAGYMSPEQVTGQDVDHRSDIFSLGVVLYELFSGQLPFKGVHETALLYEIVNVDPPPMATVKTDIDPALDAIVMECLEKDPNERSQAAKQVAVDLKKFKTGSSKSKSSNATTVQFQKGTSPASRPEAAASFHRFFWPAATALALVLAAIFAWNPWARETESRPVARFSMNVGSNLLVLTTSSIDLSQDGSLLAFAGGAGVNSEIYLRKMDQLEAHPLPGTSGALYPAISPDGRWVAFEVVGSLMKIPVSGGKAQKLCNIEGLSRGIYWENNSSILYGHVNRAIHRVSAEGGEPQLVTILDSANREISHRFPQIMPDGKTVIYTAKQDNISTFDDALIVAQRLDTGERKVLIRGGTFGRYVPTGHLIYARAGAIYAVTMDATTLTVKGPPIIIEKGGWMNSASGDAYVTFSRTGTLIFSPAEPIPFNVLTLSWLDRNGIVRSLIDSANSYFGASLSPDGQKLATTVQAANDDIWIYHLIRKTMTRFTFGGGNSSYPIWSPDGRHIFYASERGSSVDIFRKPWDGSREEDRLTNGLSVSELSSCSPNGKTLAFVQNGDIWILPFEDGQKPVPFLDSPANEATPRFSPDGNWLAYSSNESGIDEVYVVPYPGKGTKFQISSGGGTLPFWAQNGKELFFLTSSNRFRRRTAGGAVMSVQILGTSSFDYSAEQLVTPLPPSSIISDITPDGQRFMIMTFRNQGLGQSDLIAVLEWFKDLKAKTLGMK